MASDLVTVEEAAQRLKLHVKTVLRLIRDGRLKGTRIGKAYRILRSDLEAFAGIGAHDPVARTTTIVEIADLSAEAAARLTRNLQGLLIGQEARPDPVQLSTAHDPSLRQLKVVLIGQPKLAAAFLNVLATMMDNS